VIIILFFASVAVTAFFLIRKIKRKRVQEQLEAERTRNEQAGWAGGKWYKKRPIPSANSRISIIN